MWADVGISTWPILYSFGIGDFSPEQGEAEAIVSNIFEINFG